VEQGNQDHKVLGEKRESTISVPVPPEEWIYEDIRRPLKIREGKKLSAVQRFTTKGKRKISKGKNRTSKKGKGVPRPDDLSEKGVAWASHQKDPSS